MKRRGFIQSVSTTAVGLTLPGIAFGSSPENNEFTKAENVRKLFIFGGGRSKAMLSYIQKLTNKDDPKICLIPTATGDDDRSMVSWFEACEGLAIRPYVMRSFISSYTTSQSFEDTIMEMDAIMIGGGNTLNMLAIWKAQGIDLALRKAYEAGILMTGASAGSLCWFKDGTTDSRPKELSKIECLGWIQYSHCPHYDKESFRRPVYHQLIKSGELLPGYACDNDSGLLFENENLIKCVSTKKDSNSYFVELKNGVIDERELPKEIIH